MRVGAPPSARRVVAALAVAMAVLPPMASFAQTTPFVPLGDPAYRDLDALVSTGVVGDLTLGQRPYSRMAFARAISQARRGMDGEVGASKPRVSEALLRLESEFTSEIRALEATPADSAPVLPRGAWPRSIDLSASLADSPPRQIEARHTTANNIDATLNPLLQRNQGRMVGDGTTVAAEGVVDLGLGPHVAAQVQPRVWLTHDAVGGTEADATLVRGYIRALFGNLSVEVGRNTPVRGSSRNYGPVFSTNPRGMDLLRLSMEHPARLPWIFSHLGPSSFGFWVADMGGDREFPHSKLFVYEWSVRPHRNLELGAILLNHQMGEGGPEATFTQRLRDLFFLDRRRFLPLSALPAISDKVLAGNARLTIPSLRTDLYLEYMTTDDHNLFSSIKTGLGTEAAWTGGFRVTGVDPQGRLDLWMEWGRNGVRPYTHHQYTSGMTLDGRILGSPLGPLATGLTLGADWTGRSDWVSLSGAWERYQGDTYHDDPSPGTDWVRTADNPDEIRLRTTLEWTRQAEVTGLRTSVKLGYEHVTRFDFTDQNRNNFLVQVSAGYVWN